MPAQHPPVLAIVGPTASGKSALAMALAAQLGDVELVSADAMQVYRGMDIGTAKPTSADQELVPHHLIDVAEVFEAFALPRYLALANAAVDEIAGRGRRAVVVGGTGLYAHGLVDGLTPPGQWPEIRVALEAQDDTVGLHVRLTALDPTAAARMEPTNRRRVVRALEVCLGSGVPFSSFGPGLGAYPPIPTRLVGVDPGANQLDGRIEARVDAMLAAGLLAEVEALADRPEGIGTTAGQALGYRELWAHLHGRLSLDEARAETVVRTRRFARRQRRWFHRDPRILWLEGPATEGWLVQLGHVFTI